LEECGFTGAEADKCVRVTLTFAGGARTLELGRRSRFKNALYARRPDQALVGLVDFDFAQPFTYAAAEYRSREILPLPGDVRGRPEMRVADNWLKERYDTAARFLSKAVQIERKAYEFGARSAAPSPPPLQLRRNLVGPGWHMLAGDDALRVEQGRVEKVLSLAAALRIQDFLEAPLGSAAIESKSVAPAQAAIVLDDAWLWTIWLEAQADPLRLVLGSAVWGTEKRLVAFVPDRNLWGAVGDALPEFMTASAAHWRDRRLFVNHPRNAVSLEMNVPDAGCSWEFIQKGGEWQCVGRDFFPLDQTEVRHFLEKLAVTSLAAQPTNKMDEKIPDDLKTHAVLKLTFATEDAQSKSAVVKTSETVELKGLRVADGVNDKAFILRSGETVPLRIDADNIALFQREPLSFRTKRIWRVSPNIWTKIIVESFGEDEAGEGGFELERAENGVWSATKLEGKWAAGAQGASAVDLESLRNFLMISAMLSAKNFLGEASGEKEAITRLKLCPIRWKVRLLCKTNERDSQAREEYGLVFGKRKEADGTTAHWVGAWILEKSKARSLLCFMADSPNLLTPALLRGAPAPGE
jgi:hypothetical protein